MERYKYKSAAVIMSLILSLLLLSGISACKSRVGLTQPPHEELQIALAPIPAADFHEPVESIEASSAVIEKPVSTALNLPSLTPKTSVKPGVADTHITGAKPDLETAPPIGDEDAQTGFPEIEGTAAPPPVGSPPPHTTNIGAPAPQSSSAAIANAPVETPAANVSPAAVTNNAAESPSPPPSPNLSALANEVIRLTNAEREKAGLPPLTVTSLLTQTASLRANEIIQHFSHNRPDGRSCFTAFNEYGVPYKTAGENLGRGQLNAAEIVSDWMGSPGHRDNILHSGFNHIGVGVAVDSNGKLHWAQSFSD